MKIMTLVGVAAIVGVACYVGCSREERDEALTRLGKVGRALNGEVRPDDEEQDIPNIVREQQRKERVRQNTQWTAENQALHPIEYCQAKLADLDDYAQRLEVVTHKMMVAKSAATREISDNETMVKTLAAFLTDAKKAYRESAAVSNDHVRLGGYDLTLPRAKEKMVDANRKISRLQERIAKRKNMVTRLDKSLDKIAAQQKSLAETRERIQNTINDIQLKNVIEGEQGIRDALNAINDSMASLGVDYDDPSISDIVQPSKAETIDAEFEKLMAQ